ncbi:MAG: metallophosphoesterase [Victivallales bacterium]|nr:metallophosphoesterase [Victivallales bacterium]
MTRRPVLPERPPDAVRVVLFSDPHFGRFPGRFSQFLSKRVLGAFNHLLLRSWRAHEGRVRQLAELLPQLQPDVVACAGDLTSVSLPEEFTLAEQLLQPVKEVTDGLFAYVPGNHDAYVAEDAAEQALDKAFRHLNTGLELSSLPVIRRIRHLSLMLVNAAIPTAPYLSCGRIDSGMADRINHLLEAIPAGEKLAVLCHFPVLAPSGSLLTGRHGLRGADPLATPLQTGRLAAVLSGHIHHHYLVELPAGSLQVCAGSLTMEGALAIVDFPQDAKPVCHFVHLA